MREKEQDRRKKVSVLEIDHTFFSHIHLDSMSEDQAISNKI